MSLGPELRTSKEWRNKDGLLVMFDIIWNDSTKSRGIVVPRKKWLLQQLERRICPVPVLGTGICDVQLALWCPGSIVWSSQISFYFLPLN